MVHDACIHHTQGLYAELYATQSLHTEEEEEEEGTMHHAFDFFLQRVRGRIAAHKDEIFPASDASTGTLLFGELVPKLEALLDGDDELRRQLQVQVARRRGLHLPALSAEQSSCKRRNQSIFQHAAVDAGGARAAAGGGAGGGWTPFMRLGASRWQKRTTSAQSGQTSSTSTTRASVRERLSYLARLTRFGIPTRMTRDTATSQSAESSTQLAADHLAGARADAECGLSQRLTNFSMAMRDSAEIRKDSVSSVDSISVATRANTGAAPTGSSESHHHAKCARVSWKGEDSLVSYAELTEQSLWKKAALEDERDAKEASWEQNQLAA